MRWAYSTTALSTKQAVMFSICQPKLAGNPAGPINTSFMYITLPYFNLHIMNVSYNSVNILSRYAVILVGAVNTAASVSSTLLTDSADHTLTMNPTMSAYKPLQLVHYVHLTLICCLCLVSVHVLALEVFL